MEIGKLSVKDFHVLGMAMNELLKNDNQSESRQDLAERIAEIWSEMSKQGIEQVSLRDAGKPEE